MPVFWHFVVDNIRPECQLFGMSKKGSAKKSDSTPPSLSHLLPLGDSPSVPITWGARRPVIMLPKAAQDWTQFRLTSVLTHELSHIQRFDNLTHTMALIACAFHWFNPLFWRAAKWMEAESEIAADDCVL